MENREASECCSKSNMRLDLKVPLLLGLNEVVSRVSVGTSLSYTWVTACSSGGLVMSTSAAKINHTQINTKVLSIIGTLSETLESKKVISDPGTVTVGLAPVGLTSLEDTKLKMKAAKP